MTKIKAILLIILMAMCLTGCDFINNTFKYKDKTKEFVEVLIKEDYNKCIELMAMDHEMAKGTDMVALKTGLASFRKIIIDNWGTELEYTFMRAEKKFSTVKENNTPPNTALVLVEFSGKDNIGIFQLLFDDTSLKIINIKTLEVKEPMPSMTFFWIFGLLAACIPIFNIVVLTRIYQSDLTKKWLKYIAVLFLNVPAITYAATSGLSFKLLNFQILFGISFAFMGYLNSYWTFGIPIGGLYWFFKLKQRKIEEVYISPIEPNEVQPEDDNDKSNIE